MAFPQTHDPSAKRVAAFFRHGTSTGQFTPFHSTFAAEEKRIEAIRDKMSDKAAVVVGKRLGELEAIFPRHKFRFLHGNGHSWVYVSPKLFGKSQLGTFTYPTKDVIERFPALQVLMERCEELHAFSTYCEDEMQFSIGEVEATPMKKRALTKRRAR